MRIKRSVLVAAVALLLSTAACSGNATKGGAAPAASDPTKVTGDITVLTQRTDLVNDGTLNKYAAEFNKTYPNVHVKFEGITDYEGEVKIRMNSTNYGDVLLIPAALEVGEYPKFFAALGAPDQLSQKYRFVDKGTYNGQVYGLALNGNANGILYNKAVWQQAGITKWPTTPDEFLADLQAVKSKTSAIPLYTNYHDKWPMTAWQFYLGSNSCDAKANDALATDAAPWTAGKEMYQIDSLLYNVVHDKVTEPDPTTTNWENSKGLLGTGKVATMMLASWAISQMQDAAQKAGADPANIGFMPWPVQVDGHSCAVVAADYLQGVSIHSQHKEAARAWLDWFVDKGSYAKDQGLLPTLKAGAMPPALKAYQDAGVQLLELSQDKNALVTKIDNQSEVGLQKPDYRQHIVDLGRGAAGGSLDAYFAELNKKWAAAIKSVGS